MDKIILNTSRFVKKSKTVQRIHSPAHQLADELVNLFNDKKHFGLYLKLGLKYDHSFLRKIASEVMSKKGIETPGKLFSYLVGKSNKEA